MRVRSIRNSRFLWFAVGTTALFAVLSFFSKLSCTGDAFFDIIGVTRTACYNDIQAIWFGRGLALHLPPYSGGYDAVTGTLTPGTVEYPTLSGLFIWATAAFANSDIVFLIITSVLLGLAAVATTILLARIAGKRVWLWAAAPALILYTAYNWDILPVLCSVAAFTLVLGRENSDITAKRLISAGILLGVGGGLKLYPLLFVVPLVIWILLDADLGHRSRQWRVRSAIATFGAAAGVVVLSNVPFMIVNFTGWLAAFQFQSIRAIDASTMSIWYWGLRPFVDTGSESVQHGMMLASTVCTALGILAVIAVAVRSGLRRSHVSWLALCAVLLCIYLLFNKVHSPQYILWLLPFFVLLDIRIRWVLAYYVADLLAFIGWYRWNFYAASGNAERADIAMTVLTVGIAVRIVLLVIFMVILPRRSPSKPGQVSEALESPTHRLAE